MSKEITTDIIASFTEQLETHPVYDAVATLSDLQCFMEHHVYSVWDFMSLLKYIQSVVAPTKYPWLPQGDPSVRRFINELVLEEESDTTNKSGEFYSKMRGRSFVFESVEEPLGMMGRWAKSLVNN